MKESEVLFQVSQIVNSTNSFTGAVEKIRSLLDQAVIVALSSPASLPETQNSAFYAAPLRAGGRELGKLLLHVDLPHRVSNYIGEQLGMLLERSRLYQQRARLKAAFASLQEDLATRKTVQRAQGILVTRRGMTPASAKLWITQQARLARLSPREVAEQVVAVENAQRPNVFTQSRHRRIA